MKQGWKMKILGDVCEKGSSNVSQNQLVNENGDYPIYGASGFIKNVGFYHQAKPYLSIVKDGSGVGRVTKMPAYSSVIGTLQYIIPKEEIDLDYLYYSLISVDFKKYVAGAAIPHIYFKDYKNEPFLWMPFSEQKYIVEILDEAFAAIDKAKANIEKNLQNVKELFESYLQNVFTNKGEDWEEKKLEEIATVIGGYSFKSTDFKSVGKYQVLRMGNVRPGVIRNEESPVFIDKLDQTILKKALLKINDVIITQTGTKKKRDYGFTVIIDKENYLLNQRIAAIRFSENYLPKFFLYFSWTNFFKDQYFANETGTVGQGNVGIGAITNAKVPFCSIQKQKEIVSKIDFIFSEAIKLENIYQQKMDDLEELKKSILQEAFSGELTKKTIQADAEGITCL
jgi:type I restriction enzyme S subunit